MNLRSQHKFRPVKCEAGDTLKCVVHTNGRQETYEEKIGRSMVIDTIATFDVKDEFGFKDGIAAVFGESQ